MASESEVKEPAEKPASVLEPGHTYRLGHRPDQLDRLEAPL